MRSRTRNTSADVAERLLQALVLLSPLALGGAPLWALIGSAALAFAAATAALWQTPRRLPWQAWMVAAAVSWLILQIVPLPPALLRFLTPVAGDIYTTTLGPSRWHAISLDPRATARELVRLIGYGAAFVAASRLATNERRAKRLLVVVLLGALVQTGLVAVHFVLNTHRIFGVVHTTIDQRLLGTFGNGNHLAAFLSLGALVAAGLSLRTEERDPDRRFLVAGVAISAIAVLTFSRSGVAGLFAGWITLAVLSMTGDPDERRRLVALGIALGALAVVAVAFWGGGFTTKWAALAHPSRLWNEEKVSLWRDAAAIARDFWKTGVGRGSFEQILPRYRFAADDMSFSHVECGPLQALVDFGVLAGTALVVGWTWSLIRAARRPAGRSAVAATAALIGLSVHELGDFSLEGVFAVGAVAAVLWGIVLPAQQRTESGRAGRAVAIAVAGLALVAAALGSLRGSLEQDAAKIARENDPRRRLELISGAMSRHPADPYFPLQAARLELDLGDAGGAVRDINRCLFLSSPTRAWRPHMLAGEALWKLRRRSQALLEFRTAYRDSGFMDWIPDGVAHIHGVPKSWPLSLAGDDPAATTHLIDYLLRRQDPTDARRLADEAVLLAPDDPHAQIRLARVALQQGDVATAERATRSVRPDDTDAVLLRVDALDRLDRDADGDSLLAAAKVARPSPDLNVIAADRLVRRGRYADALTELSRLDSISFAPSDLSRLHRVRARAYEGLGRVREALRELADAARIDPTPDNRIALAELYERSGIYRSALLVYRDLSRTAGAPADISARIQRAQAKLSSTPELSGDGSSLQAAPFDNAEDDSP